MAHAAAIPLLNAQLLRDDSCCIRCSRSSADCARAYSHTHTHTHTHTPRTHARAHTHTHFKEFSSGAPCQELHHLKKRLKELEGEECIVAGGSVKAIVAMKECRADLPGPSQNSWERRGGVRNSVMAITAGRSGG